MNRPSRRLGTALLGTLLVAIVAVIAIRGHDPRPALRPAPALNPGGFVASDVARLSTTGRPQLVEIFHYG
jgi:hypothetical protein